MKAKPLIICLIFLSNISSLIAQQKYTVSGTISDGTTAETIKSVVVYVNVNEVAVQAVSNEYGFYSLTLPEGKHNLIYRYTGCKIDTVVVNLNASITVNHSLSKKTFELREVVVSAEKKNENLRRTEIGVEKLDVESTENIPVIFGERDILKIIQLFAGVKPAGEGNSGFYVRGGNVDQNLILLDEASVYNTAHLLGFFSTFNSDAIKDVSFIKGNYPAQYGGRLSSVLDVKMREGNIRKYGGTGGLGLISSRLSLEGPIVKDKSSFIVSGRRSYADIFLKASDKYKDDILYFYDFNAKLNFKINDKNRIFVSGYFGRDVMGLSKNYKIGWGNKNATLRWNSIISSRMFSNTSLIYSDYKYNLKVKRGDTFFNINSRIQDCNLKEEIQYFPGPGNTIKFGFNSTYHKISPQNFTGENINTGRKYSRYAFENAVFANNVMKVGKKLTLEYGLRISSYTILGGDTYNIYKKGILTDSVVLSKGKFAKTYINFEPRLQFSLMLGESRSIKGGYARNTQNLHLMSNSMISIPSDQWVGDSYNIKPEICDQLSIGYYRNFDGDKYQLSAETYYKRLRNQIDFKDAANIYTVPDIESELLFGIGRTYGIELTIKKTSGKLTGWAGYTLSKAERKIGGINNDRWYPVRQDRTHDLSVVANFQISKNWSISGIFVYSTGNAVTFPSGKYRIDGSMMFYYTERNGYRMPAYHRMDFAATYSRITKRKYESSWNFSLYNVYGRENAYMISFQTDWDDATRTKAVQTSLFRWIPSISYNFKF